MKIDNITKGTLTELRCMTSLIELGYNVSVPQRPTRYDFILDTGKQLLKIQVKTSSLKRANGCFTFATASRRRGKNKIVSHNCRNDGIDYFCTWFDNNCYLIPVAECGTNEKNLRLAPTNNGQAKNIAFAKDYLAQEVLSKLL